MTTSLQKENIQLKANQLFLSKPKTNLVAEDDKVKFIIYFQYLEDKEFHINGRRPKTRGLKRQKGQGSEPTPPLGQQDIKDTIEAELEKEKENWLGSVNEHLEMILKKADKGTNLERHMERHYFIKNQICNIRVRNMKMKLKKTLNKLNKRDNLDFLADASFVF